MGSSPPSFGSFHPSPEFLDTIWERVRDGLESLDGVVHVVLDIDGPLILLVCDPAIARRKPTEAAARALLSREGVFPEDIEILVSFTRRPEPSRRVRLASVRVEHSSTHQSRVRVALEWRGKQFARAADGEHGVNAELRLAVDACLRALHDVLEGIVCFRCIGVKQVRIFDHEMVVVLLGTEAPGRQWVGVSRIADGDHAHAAAAATLNATNRLLGNYLAVDG